MKSESLVCHQNWRLRSSEQLGFMFLDFVDMWQAIFFLF